MNITSVDNKYLTYTELVENTQIDRICYVVDIDSSMSRLNLPFFSLLVRTTDSKIMPCMVFDVDDFLSMGFKLNALKGKFIRLNCKVKLFNNRLTLHFISCEVVTPTVDEINLFQKKLPGIDGYFENINDIFTTTIDKKLPVYFKVSTYPSIYNGLVGGYVKFCWDVMMHCQALIIDSPYDDFMEILYETIINYHNYLQLESKINLLSDSDRVELVSKLPINDNKDRLIRDTVCAVIGLTKPEHIVSNIIYSTFNYIKTINSMKEDWDTLRPGGVYSCQEYQLKRY